MVRVEIFGAVVVAAVVGVASFAHGPAEGGVGVEAAELPRSGEYSARHRISGRFQGVNLVDGVAAATLEFVVDVISDEALGFLHGAKGHRIGIALDQIDGPTGSGACSFKDPEGDGLFLRFVEGPYTSSATVESTGGTGKYAEIEVRQTHRTLYCGEFQGGRFEARGVRAGVWQRAE